MRRCAVGISAILAMFILGQGSALAADPPFIGVPAGYVYDPSLGNLHDYCSYSPDWYGSVDLRGPCAMHDMCYERKEDKQRCDQEFRLDIGMNCRYVYREPGIGLNGCYDAAEAYYQAVANLGRKTDRISA
ncbi:hypothetical protein D5S17_07735 [Pseudonocardiaceae bacterium YIM PH 21723]|nr:hypothetical protein D5S17_07735 [Pseudonocardiaceae bacterium YIM PH 21723]